MREGVSGALQPFVGTLGAGGAAPPPPVAAATADLPLAAKLGARVANPHAQPTSRLL